MRIQRSLMAQRGPWAGPIRIWRCGADTTAALAGMRVLYFSIMLAGPYLVLACSPTGALMSSRLIRPGLLTAAARALADGHMRLFRQPQRRNAQLRARPEKPRRYSSVHRWSRNTTSSRNFAPGVMEAARVGMKMAARDQSTSDFLLESPANGIRARRPSGPPMR